LCDSIQVGQRAKHFERQHHFNLKVMADAPSTEPLPANVEDTSVDNAEDEESKVLVRYFCLESSLISVCRKFFS
jgi:hypothetical protein